MGVVARYNTAGFNRLVAESKRTPKLSREDELTLWTAWTAGDRRAGNRLATGLLRTAVSVAILLRRYGFPLDELVAEGMVGSAIALRKYDPTRGNRLVAYAAAWIKCYMLAHICKNWHIVGGSQGALRSNRFFGVRKLWVSLENAGVPVDERLDQVALKFELPREDVYAAVQMLLKPASDFSDPGVAQAWARTHPAPGPDEGMVADEAAVERLNAVALALRELDPRERLIVDARHLADREDELSLAELARRMGVSRERARQLEARALRKLREALGVPAPPRTERPARFSHRTPTPRHCGACGELGHNRRSCTQRAAA